MDLFDSRDLWVTDPASAFDAFVLSPEFLELSRRLPGDYRSRPLRSSSATVYRAMMRRFLAWMHAATPRNFTDATAADIAAFLDHQIETEKGSRPAFQSTIKYRYLRLLERTYRHLHMEPNPAAQVTFSIYNGDRQKAGRDQPMATLSNDDHEAFINALPESSKNWKRSRDRALQVLMLEAGLKVSEVIGLYSENVGTVDSSGRLTIHIPAAATGGTALDHLTKLRPSAVAILQEWLEVRKARSIDTRLLFPTALVGETALNKSTVYRQVRTTFERAGIAVSRRGGRTLRNTFAIKELGEGTAADVERVQGLLGHRRKRSTEYYLAAKRKK